MMTLQELFTKYNKPKLNGGCAGGDPPANCTIESRGDGMGTVLIASNKQIMGSTVCFPIVKLLQIPININSWNEYSWGTVWCEETIANELHDELTTKISPPLRKRKKQKEKSKIAVVI